MQMFLSMILLKLNCIYIQCTYSLPKILFRFYNVTQEGYVFLYFQCTNGHLMCAGCFSHLLADARLKDETATCPNCRCELNKNQCSRNLAVEKAISELPAECQYCAQQLPRSGIGYHEKEICQERCVPCAIIEQKTIIQSVTCTLLPAKSKWEPSPCIEFVHHVYNYCFFLL